MRDAHTGTKIPETRRHYRLARRTHQYGGLRQNGEQRGGSGGGGGVAGSLTKGDAESAERISWQEVYDIWFQSDDDGLSNVQAHHVVTISTVQAHPWSMNWSR